MGSSHCFVVLAVVACIFATVGAGSLSATTRTSLASLKLQGILTFDDTMACSANPDIVSAGVVYPSSVEDIATIVRAVASSESELTVAARGLGHNIRGRSQVPFFSMTSSEIFIADCLVGGTVVFEEAGFVGFGG